MFVRCFFRFCTRLHPATVWAPSYNYCFATTSRPRVHINNEINNTQPTVILAEFVIFYFSYSFFKPLSLVLHDSTAFFYYILIVIIFLVIIVTRKSLFVNRLALTHTARGWRKIGRRRSAPKTQWTENIITSSGEKQERVIHRTDWYHWWAGV